MRKYIFLFLLLSMLVGCGGSGNNGNELPTMMPTQVIDESPRTEATPDPGLPPTWTPIPQDVEGHIFDVGGGETAVGTRFIYTVQRGDTLGIIAARYSVTVADLVALNNITNPNVIEVGQQLIIPVSGE
ncbi:MAG: LysM peptidoglycan-binding domain-containing protein [Ardenticatenaceae bacterium]|nr:LysM peptidoglycan-binding domain-containing protein [Anaerolineales bacterium]MCB8921766.1 LysM peptidoglycan-binding domain-containing protein [Ardenticatenaceae bacterium]MCB8990715.1 LysM peptidoglycan-binding domain-containing protein [Ardenticatenaceae bacterium]